VRKGALAFVLLVLAAGWWTKNVPLSGRAPSIDGLYFSEKDCISERISAAINHARTSLDVAVYDITDPEIAAALESARRRNVAVRVVSDERQAHNPHSEIGTSSNMESACDSAEATVEIARSCTTSSQCSAMSVS
jgi:hypothetical protein